MQQRGIRGAALEALLAYGRVVRVHGGRDIVFFDKKARARLARERGAGPREGRRLFGTYAILGEGGKVVTVGHRYRRIRRR